MNTTLPILADLGLLRTYHDKRNAADRQPHLELIEGLKLESAITDTPAPRGAIDQANDVPRKLFVQ